MGTKECNGLEPSLSKASLYVEQIILYTLGQRCVAGQKEVDLQKELCLLSQTHLKPVGCYCLRVPSDRNHLLELNGGKG